MRWLADLLYVGVGLAYLPIAIYQALVVGKNRRGWGQRLGFVPRLSGNKPRIWIHAVSLGEINATPKLVAGLRESFPDHEIVFSSTTDTGCARAVALYGAASVFRFPLDFSPVIARALRRIRPTMIVLVELEVWYNLVRMASRRGIPVAVVNGRLTERSAKWLARLGPFAHAMFGDLAWVGAQDETIAARFRKLGVRPERVTVTSSLKWDSAEVGESVDGDGALAAALGIDGVRPLWVCGSTGPGEEKIVLEAYRKILERHEGTKARSDEGTKTGRHGGTEARTDEGGAPLLCIVPRKPERFDEVARLIERTGFRCVRRSDFRDGTNGAARVGGEVILGDTMGELRKFYALADVVFVGRSLVSLGGSDPMEAAALGKPIIVGPHVENFRLPVEALRVADGLRVVETVEELADTVGSMVGDGAMAESVGSRAKRVVIANQGATRRTVNRLVQLLEG